MAEFVRCKRCRLTLISNQELECVTTCHGNTNVAEDHPCCLDKSVIYIKEEEMPNWIENLVQLVSISSFEILKPLFFINSFFFQANWTKGKIICPSASCAARLGSFDFCSGQKCECQQFVLPPVRLVSSKVDKLKLDTRPAVN